MLKMLFWPALAVGIAAAAAVHAETCAEQVAREIADMRRQQADLRAGPHENGPIQELGQCTRQALRLGLTFAVRGPASEKDAAREELANCLQLRIEAISHSCYCRQLGADIERDLDMHGLAGRMEDVGNAYQRMTQAADRARQRAIQNPLIQQYVADAEKYRQCYDRITLNTLDELARKLDAVEYSAPSDGNGPTVSAATPTVNAPTVDTSTPIANAPAVKAPTPAARAPTINAATPAINAPAANARTLADPAAGSGAAQAGNCNDLRNNIAAMDAQSNAMPGYLGMRVQLASIYNRLCGSSPAQRTEYWYTIDGKQLGLVSAGRPAGAAYSATAEIGGRCAGTANPSMCALAAGAYGNCQAPYSPDLTEACKVPGGYGDPADTVTATGGDPLPPGRLTVGGRTYELSDICARSLARAGDGGRSASALKYCSDDLLDALASLEGIDRNADPTAFLRGLTPVVQKGFALPGTSPMGGFDAALCAQAERNAQICKQRQNDMGPVGQAGEGTSGQAGAFNDCYLLYSRFAGMCRMNVNQRPQIAAASAPKVMSPAKPAPPAPKPTAAKPADATPRSAPPSQPPQMSQQCQQLVSNYVAAAQANDGPRALASYNALKGAGGCGVLAQVDRPMPAPQASAGPSANDPRFVARGARPLSDEVVGGCDASPAECERRVQQLRAGVSPEAQAAIWSNAIGIGLQLGSAMANGLSMAAPVGAAGGTNMNSIGNRPVHSTYGQGAPTYRPQPPQRPSDITGTK